MTPDSLDRLYSRALKLNRQNSQVIEALRTENEAQLATIEDQRNALTVLEYFRRENALLRETVQEQRQLLRAMEEGYSMRRTA